MYVVKSAGSGLFDVQACPQPLYREPTLIVTDPFTRIRSLCVSFIENINPGPEYDSSVLDLAVVGNYVLVLMENYTNNGTSVSQYINKYDKATGDLVEVWTEGFLNSQRYIDALAGPKSPTNKPRFGISPNENAVAVIDGRGSSLLPAVSIYALSNGTILDSWGVYGAVDPLLTLSSRKPIVVDPDGNVYIIETSKLEVTAGRWTYEVKKYASSSYVLLGTATFGETLNSYVGLNFCRYRSAANDIVCVDREGTFNSGGFGSSIAAVIPLDLVGIQVIQPTFPFEFPTGTDWDLSPANNLASNNSPLGGFVTIDSDVNQIRWMNQNLSIIAQWQVSGGNGINEPCQVAMDQSTGVAYVAACEDNKISRCIVLEPEDIVKKDVFAPTFQQAISNSTATFSTENTGGLVAGIIVIALAPFIVAAIGFGRAAVVKKKNLVRERSFHNPYFTQDQKETAVRDSEATLAANMHNMSQKKTTIVLTLRVVIFVIALAGVGFIGYILYDYVLFVQQSNESETLLDEALQRLSTVAEYSRVDCAIVSDAYFRTHPACVCGLDNVTNIWSCNRIYNSTYDCSVDDSLYCICNRTESEYWVSEVGAYYPYWSCDKADFTSAGDEVEEDAGLRFIPPGVKLEGVSDVLRSVVVPSNTPRYQLLFAEPQTDITPISTALLVSLIANIVGFIILGIIQIYKWLWYRDSCCKGCKEPKFMIGSKKFDLLTVLELAMLGINIILFGVVLIIAFTDPVTTSPVSYVQPVFIGPSVNRIYDNAKPPVGKPECFCGFYPSTVCDCNENGTAVFSGSIDFSSPNSLFTSSVLVMGDAVVTQATGISGSFEVRGNLVIDGPLSVLGDVIVGQNLSGSIFVENFETHSDLFIRGNIQVTDSMVLTERADLSGVQGLISVGNFISGAGLRVQNLTDILVTQINDTGLIHAENSMTLPFSVFVDLRLSYYPFPPFQIVSSGGSLTGAEEVSVKFDGVDEQKKDLVCGPAEVIPTRIANGGNTGVFVSYTAICPPFFNATVIPPWTISDANFTFDLSLGPYPLGGQGDTIVAKFTHTNCFQSDVEYRLEQTYISLFQTARFGSWLYSLCPLENITQDPILRCFNYSCQGTFTLPNTYTDQTVTDVQDNIIQGVVFDAVATALDILGIVLEFLILPLAIMKMV